MADRPTGTVTFLFTDIEGSTCLWEQHPQAMAGALARHDAIMRQAIAAESGVVYQVIATLSRPRLPRRRPRVPLRSRPNARWPAKHGV